MTEMKYRRIRLADGSYLKVLSEDVLAGWNSQEGPLIRTHSPESLEGSFAAGPSRVKGLASQGTNALLIGCGSVGSHVGLSLARMGFNLVAIDNDSVERSNIEAGRTAYGAETLGMAKVHALAHTVRNLGLTVEVVPFRRRIEEFSDEEIRALAYEANVVIAAFDDGGQLLRVNSVLYPEARVVYPGFHSGAISGHVIWTRPQNVPCFRCSIGVESEGEIETLHGEPAIPLDIERVSEMTARVALWLCAPETSESSGLLDPARNIIFMENRPSGSPERILAVQLLEAKRDPFCPVCGNLSPGERG